MSLLANILWGLEFNQSPGQIAEAENVSIVVVEQIIENLGKQNETIHSD